MAGKILIVDDVATNRIILKAKLAISCYDVIQAADGRQALTVARNARPDLILLDLAMPGMDGLEVCKRLKNDPETAGIPVVVITAHADTRSKIAALRAGAEDFLTKPVDDMVLAARVRSLLRARVLEEELELHEGTRRALGFSEAQAGYHAGAADGAGAAAKVRPAHIALIGASETLPRGLDETLAQGLPHRIERLDRAEVLRRVREASMGRPDGHAGDQRPDWQVPEVFVIGADIEVPGDGLLLLAELRASLATRHAAILIALPRDGRAAAPMALDLGASDLLMYPLDAEEVGLRVTTQLARSRAAAIARRRLRDGLELAVTDSLTGLYNRRYALSHLDRVVARAKSRGRGFAVMALDLDRFKEVNDRFGHAAGDTVLQTVAKRLEAALRPQDLVARIGGEEFLAVLPDIEPKAARRAADRLCRAVRETPVRVGPEAASAEEEGGAVTAREPDPAEIWPTVSIGLVIVPGDGPFGGGVTSPASASDLVARADRALYAAKAAGRDRVSEARAHGLTRPTCSGHAAA